MGLGGGGGEADWAPGCLHAGCGHPESNPERGSRFWLGVDTLTTNSLLPHDRAAHVCNQSMYEMDFQLCLAKNNNIRCFFLDIRMLAGYSD